MKRRVSLKRLVIPGVCLLMAAGTLALGLTYRAGIPDMGLADARNIRDIPRGATAIEYAWGEKPEDEPWMEEKDFAMVDGEYELRSGEPDYTGRLCVIGTDLAEDKLNGLFGLE